MKRRSIVMPKFVNEAQEADWWASNEGREFIKQRSARTGRKEGTPRGSRLVGKLNKVVSVQIALRLPEPDLAKAREIAARKGIGYQCAGCPCPEARVAGTGAGVERVPHLLGGTDLRDSNII